MREYRKLGLVPEKDTVKKPSQESRPSPESNGFRIGGMDEATWKSISTDPAAKEFVAFHSEMLTGGFQYFWNRHTEENGGKYNVLKAQDFVLKYAPGHWKLFVALTNEALQKAKSGQYTKQDDKNFSERYKQFSTAMEQEIEGKWDRAKGVKVEKEKKSGAEKEH